MEEEKQFLEKTEKVESKKAELSKDEYFKVITIFSDVDFFIVIILTSSSYKNGWICKMHFEQWQCSHWCNIIMQFPVNNQLHQQLLHNIHHQFHKSLKEGFLIRCEQKRLYELMEDMKWW